MDKSSETGQCPWIQWTLSMDSVNIVNGFSGLTEHCPWTSESLDFVHSDLVKKIEVKVIRWPRDSCYISVLNKV